MKYKFLKGLLLISVAFLMCAGLCSCGNSAVSQSGEQTEINSENTALDAEDAVQKNEETAEESFDINRADTENYTLEKVLVLSRHNIRSPLSSNGSVNEIATPHKWYEWTAPSSELSLKGGVLETIMGQYFRKWLEKEGLFARIMFR